MQRNKRLQELLTSIVEAYPSQSAAAEAMGINIKTFSTYINGLKYPDLGNLEKIADFLHITYADLVAQLEGINAQRETKVDIPFPEKADDALRLLIKLPDREKQRLIRYLVEMALP